MHDLAVLRRLNRTAVLRALEDAARIGAFVTLNRLMAVLREDHSPEALSLILRERLWAGPLEEVARIWRPSPRIE